MAVLRALALAAAAALAAAGARGPHDRPEWSGPKGVELPKGNIDWKTTRPPKPSSYNTTNVRKEGVLNVHIIAHTHDDVGWLKTVDEYFYGNQNNIQRAVVQNILNSVIKELAWNPDRKFSYVEQAFFQRWWSEADPAMQALVHKLVANGQLEFINGGWSMHDEAAPSFVDMVDQTTLGHRLLKNQFNVTPRTTWQIDPFGHSGFQASYMSSPYAGYNAVFFMRADYQDKAAREQSKSMEWVWAPSRSRGALGATLGGILYGGYCTWGELDMQGDASPIMDDPNLEDYNVGSIVDDFVNYIIEGANQFPNSGAYEGDIMLMQGCDFNFEWAATWFTNMDKLVYWCNQDGRVNCFYSTPGEYAAARLSAGNTYPFRSDDMFPYADDPHGYWTGYTTSRAALKGYVRDTSSIFQAAKQLQAVSAITSGDEYPAPDSPANPLYRMERAMGVTQHHDAVAGTSKQHVANDYAKRLSWSRADAASFYNTTLRAVTGDSSLNVYTCDLANATICPPLEAAAGTTALFLYNSQGQAVSGATIRLPVGTPTGVASYAVAGPTGAAVTAQLLPLSPVDSHLRTEYYGYNSVTPVQWLAFQASLPAAGFAAYFITPAATPEAAPSTHITLPRPLQLAGQRLKGKSKGMGTILRGDQTLSNGIITITIDGTTGLVSSYANAATGISTPFAQEWLYYRSSTGTAQDGQPSGAYIFRTNVTSTFPVTGNGNPTLVTVITGPVVSEARQTFGSWASTVVSLPAGADYSDFQWQVGPIDFADGWGKEVIVRYSTPLATNGTWYTDSNCRDTMERIRNYRFSWNYTVEEPVAGNYAPVNCLISTSDVATGTTLSVVVDRSEGGASIADGSVELMVHRRLLHDDYRGVGEPLNETGIDGNGLVVRGTHRVSVDPASKAGAARRAHMQDLLYRPYIGIAPLPAGTTPTAWINGGHVASTTALTAPLPANVHLMTVHYWGNGQLLLRVAHVFETGEDAQLSQPATVQLANLFAGFTITGATETTLTGNQPLAAAPQTTYALQNGTTWTLPVLPAAPAGASLSITLQPMEIRTFLCNVQV